LIDHIKGCGYTQEQLAKLSGVPRVSICKFCNGARRLTSENIGKIADALNLTIVIAGPVPRNPYMDSK
ncbi:helix-turn-helix transcriptional regulator, partial [Tautonia marina]|uniref:helix-turn-helix transcriptional regulator n=1 Tax=Tautonia marina TaxID=2653855 RepID=UPI001375B8B7